MLEFKLANYFEISPDSIHLFWKGRVGLYSVLSSMGIKSGDEVVIPAFTCVVVANAIIYRGARPVYVDVNPSNLQYDKASLEQAVSDNTKLIIVQNTFGIPPDYSTVENICKQKGISCIEDCTHGMGTLHENKKTPPAFIKASFYSFQWNKPLSAGLGGMVLCNDAVLNAKIQDQQKDLESPSLLDALSLSVLLKIRPLLDAPFLYAGMLRLFRFLSAKGLVLGSSNSNELMGVNMPDSYFKGMSGVQRRSINRSIVKLDQLIAIRKANYSKFDKVFQDLGLFRLELDGIEHSALKFPIFVKDKIQFKQIAERKGIKLGDWMNSPIHPVETGFEQWYYTLGQCKQAEFLSSHILNLQTDLSDKETKRTISFIQENRSLFLLR